MKDIGALVFSSSRINLFAISPLVFMRSNLYLSVFQVELGQKMQIFLKISPKHYKFSILGMRLCFH